MSTTRAPCPNNYQQYVLLTWKIAEWMAYWKFTGDSRSDASDALLYEYASDAVSARGPVWVGADDAYEYTWPIVKAVWGMYSESNDVLADSIKDYLAHHLTNETPTLRHNIIVQ